VTYTYICAYTAHFERFVYLQLPLESINPVFQRISIVYADIWLRLYSPRAVNHYSVAATLFFCTSLPLPSPRSSSALHRNYTKRPTRDDTGVKREIGRAPRVRRVPPFENCPATLACSRSRLSNTICQINAKLHLFCAREVSCSSMKLKKKKILHREFN